MRLFIAFLFFLSGPLAVMAQTMTSQVYQCQFTNNLTETESLRMKDYFDPDQNVRLGKVDVMRLDEVVESTPTKVYQIPLWDQQIYIQIWQGTDLRVDAQMSLTSSNRNFYGTYTKASLQRPIFCTNLRN